MTPEQRHQECTEMIDKLESDYDADPTHVHRARLKLALLATEKMRHDFHAAATRIRWRLAQLCGIDEPKKLYDEKDE